MNKDRLKQYEKDMAEWIDGGDIEICHSEADRILAEFVTELGYKKLIDLYNKVDKWYA